MSKVNNKLTKNGMLNTVLREDEYNRIKQLIETYGATKEVSKLVHRSPRTLQKIKTTTDYTEYRNQHQPIINGTDEEQTQLPVSQSELQSTLERIEARLATIDDGLTLIEEKLDVIPVKSKGLFR